MASEITRAIYRITSEDKPVTAAGVCYVLRDMFTPILSYDEAERSLDWLARNGVLTRRPSRGFGTEYVRRPKD